MLRYVFIMFTICLEEEKVERNKKNRTKRQENGPDQLVAQTWSISGTKALLPQRAGMPRTRLVAQKRCATDSWSPFGRFLKIFEYLLDIIEFWEDFGVLGLFRESGRDFGVGENLRESFSCDLEWMKEAKHCIYSCRDSLIMANSILGNVL